MCSAWIKVFQQVIAIVIFPIGLYQGEYKHCWGIGKHIIELIYM